ncbi:hypothetical protein [Helicobacter rodentium]|nr:hypothetical protein [Helicobacter rodentium]
MNLVFANTHHEVVCQLLAMAEYALQPFYQGFTRTRWQDTNLQHYNLRSI